MKLKNIFKSLILGTLLLSAGGCHDDIFDADGRWTGKIPDEITVNLVVPDPEVVNIGGSRADIAINDLRVILFDGDNGTGNVIKNEPVDFKVDGDVITATLPLTPDTKNVQIVANAGTNMGNSDNKPYEIFVKDKTVLWGQKNVAGVVKDETITLVRNTANISVSLASEVENFEVLSVYVFGTAEKGSLAPDPSNLKEAGKILSKDATVSDNMTYLYGEGGTGNTDNDLKYDWAPDADGIHMMTGFFETPSNIGTAQDKNYVRVIIEGKYTNAQGVPSKEGFYVVQLAERSGDKDENGNKISGNSEDPDYYQYSEEPLPILRNHEYKINITEVRSEGWPQLSQAKTALPDNRLTVEVEDKVPDVTDIEATRDYYLGVGGDVEAFWDKDAKIVISTTYPGLSGKVEWKDRVQFEIEDEDNWIKIDEVSLDPEETSISSGDELKLYLSMKLGNNTSPEDRYGQIKVRAGKLSRVINITQLGCPYDRMRKVELSGISSSPITDYFSFIDGYEYDTSGNQGDKITDQTKYVKGISFEANRNVNRTGLHFPVVPLYNDVTYKIKKEATDGEATFLSRDDLFEVKEKDGYWVITMKDPAVIKSGVGKLRIPMQNEAGETVNVDYDVFRTGIIHFLSEDMAKDYQPNVPSVQRWGWYYYEVVKVGNCYMLDRNLGAESNLPYSPGSSEYKKNTSAIGGYFKANSSRWADFRADKNKTEDKQTITHDLGLTAATPDNGRFVMASEADYNSFQDDTHHYLTFGTVVSAQTQGGRVKDNIIYFPKTGYYEGEELRDQMHCQLWTRTYLGGTQGMDVEKSPDYGYWYRYFDDIKSEKMENKFSNIRMARGSNGQAPTDASVWRYMPLRLVWVNKNCVNATGVDNDEAVVSGKMVIYFYNTLSGENWDDLQYYAWDVAYGGHSFTSPGTPVKVANNLYKMEVGAPKNNNSGILFLHDGVQTNDFKELSQRYNQGQTVLVITQNGKGDNGRYNLTVDRYGDTESIINSITGGTSQITYTYQVRVGSSNVSLTKTGNEYVSSETTVAANSTLSVIETPSQGSSVSYDKFSGTTLGVANTYSNSGNAWTLTEAGTYTFTLNPSAKTLKVVKKQETPSPTDKVLYTPGTASNWFNTTPMYITTADNGNTYEGVVYLAEGEFKFSTALNWSSDNYGKGDEDGKLKKGGNANIPVTTSGFYWLKADLSNSNDLKYEIEIIELVSAIGDFNKWESDVDLTNSTADSPYSSKVPKWSGTVQFNGGKWKLRANHKWGNVDWGATTDNAPWSNASLNVVVKKGRDMLAPGNGKYKITLDLTKLPFQVTYVEE